MSFDEKIHFVKLEVLSPVHVGTGESLDPFAYVMHEDAASGKPFLHYIDLPAFVENHRNPDELTRRFQGEFQAVRSFIAQTPEILGYTTSKAEVISRGIFAEYKQKLNDPRNQLKIAPSLKNSDSKALLIPGSSVKGAIRTAVIDHLDRKYKLDLKGITQRDDYRGSRYTEKLESLFGRITDSIFKNLKVGDFEAPPDSACFVEAKEIGKKPDRKTSTPKDPCETLPGVCMGRTTILFGKISLGCFTAKAPGEATFSLKADGITENWTLPELMALCTSFYKTRFAKELAEFYEKQHFNKSKQAVKRIEPLLADMKPGEMLLRVGHYSHIECMTITNNLPQTRKTRDGGMMPSGTTRTLADGIHPFGWIKVSLCGADEYGAGMEMRRAAAEAAVYSAAPAPTPKALPVEKEKISWPAALLTWNPGSGTLYASFEGKKAELKLGADRSLVPEAMHTKLFKKKDAVKAEVTLEKDGNMLKIVKIEFS